MGSKFLSLIAVLVVAQVARAAEFSWSVSVKDMKTMEIKTFEPSDKSFSVPLPKSKFKCALGTPETTKDQGVINERRYLRCTRSGGNLSFASLCAKTSDGQRINGLDVVGVGEAKDDSDMYWITVRCD